MSTLFRLSMRRAALSSLAISAVLLAACGGGERKSDTQIAATVNKGEISVHQVQTVLQRQPRLVAADAGGTASARVLEGLIDQELAAQAAHDASLEKDPRVVQSIEAARRELLALALNLFLGEGLGVAPFVFGVGRIEFQLNELGAEAFDLLLHDSAHVVGLHHRAESPWPHDLTRRETGCISAMSALRWDTPGGWPADTSRGLHIREPTSTGRAPR